MTPQEAIKNLKKLKSYHNGSYGTAIDIAIKALEQEPKSITINELEDRLDALHEKIRDSCMEYYINGQRKMDDYDITDKYGAIVLLKGIIEETRKQMDKKDIMSKTYQLVNECLVNDINEIQAEIYKDFVGTIQNLARVNDDIEKENEDD